MPSTTEITVTQLSRLIGLPDAPRLIDVRSEEDYKADPRLLPAARRTDINAAQVWAKAHAGKNAVVICQNGAKLSQGIAAILRNAGVDASTLEGGFEAWRTAKAPLIITKHIPKHDNEWRTTWVTRARPKIDRIACPWLIRRFIDRKAVFLFVAPSEVLSVAEKFNATPFDIEDVFWSHRGDTCTFDTMIEEFGLGTHEPLALLAKIVRGADTATLDLSPQSAGLLAASLGFSRMFKNDLQQLDAALSLYDAFYRWCRDGRDETHNWPAAKKAA